MSAITLLDGSIGQELVKRSLEPPTPFWSTSVMLAHPHLTEALHSEYFTAGATIATTNTYAVLEDRFDQMGDLGVPFDQIVATAIGEAAAARDRQGSGRIAGSMGPLMASYRPDICPPPEEAAAMYAGSVALLAQHVDCLIFETMSSVEQTEGALLAGRGSGIPVWLAVTVEDFDGAHLRSGEPLQDLAPVLARYRPDAVLINCSRPEAVAAGLDILSTFGLPFGAYANGFTKISEAFLNDAPTVDALEQRTDLDPDTYADLAMGWIAQGATIVGGCCEVGPDHIAEIARRLRADGHEIV